MESFSWDAPYFNTFNYSWEQHPNFLTNLQDDGTYTSFSPPRNDWNNTSINTFNQSWEENFDHFSDFQGSDPCHGFTSFVSNNSFENVFEQPEPSHSFEEFSENFTENLTTFLENFTSTFEALNDKMGQLVDELRYQNRGPFPNDNEKSKCVGKDESDVEKKEFEICEPSFCDDNTFTEVIPLAVRSVCLIKSLGILHGSCSMGDVVGRTFGKVEVSIILKPLHLQKMHMWGGESHPT